MPSTRVLAPSLLAVAALTLTATASAAPTQSVLQATPSSFAFADHDIYNGQRTFQNFVLSNSSGATVNVGSIGLSGPNASAFDVENSTCGTLNDGDTCSFDVGFAPGTQGANAAQVQIQDSTGELDLDVSGNGITGTLGVDQNPVVLPAQPYFYGNRSTNVNLQASDAGVQVSSITFTGPDAGLFSVAYGQNCANAQLNAGNSCGFGVGFSPTAAGDFSAQMVIASNSDTSPLVIPVTARSLAGPHLSATGGSSSNELAFGNTRVGVDSARALTLTNDGDFDLQLQQGFILTGLPQTFFITDDRCSLRVLAPGDSCTLTPHFKPAAPGPVNATLLLISNSPTLNSVGLSGTGVASPSGSAIVTGKPAVGENLTCQPTGYPDGVSFAYQWTRDGQPIDGATASTYQLVSADSGRSIACGLHASNGAGATDAVGNSAPISDLDLSGLSNSIVDSASCRYVSTARSLQVGDAPAVKLSAASPVTAWSPLRVTSAASFGFALDGSGLGRAKSLTLYPRDFDAFADGLRSVTYTSGDASLAKPFYLAPCEAAAYLDGGPHETSVLRASTRTQMRSATFALPKGLTMKAVSGHRSLQLAYQTGDGAVHGFNVRGSRGSANGVSVVLGRKTIVVSNLPAQTGVLRLSFTAGLITGKGGSVSFYPSASSTKPAVPSAVAPALWSTS